MRDYGDDIDPAEAMLAELAGLDLTLARHVHACAMARDEPKVVADLARAYQRVARSARMTLALHARLKRERLRGGEAGAGQEGPEPNGAPPERPAASAAPPAPDAAHADERRTALRTALRRIVWAEREREAEVDLEAISPEALLAHVERRLARREAAFGRQFRDDAWEELPLDEHVVRLCRMVGLPDAAAAGWRDLPDPPDDTS